MSTEVIAASIGAGATICVSLVPIVLRLHTMVCKSKAPDQDDVLDELSKVNVAYMERLSTIEPSIRLLLEDALETYTTNLVYMLYKDASRKPSLPKRTSMRESTSQEPSMRFQSLLPNAGNETTDRMLRQVQELYLDYYLKISVYKGLDAQIRFLTHTYEYFVHTMVIPTTICPTDLVIYNNRTNAFTLNLTLKHAHHEQMGIHAHYMVVQKTKQRTGPHTITHAPMYLKRFGTMDALLDSTESDGEANGARKVWREWLHDNFTHSIVFVSFMGRYTLHPLEVCTTNDLITIISLADTCSPNTLELVKTIHTGVYSFMACVVLTHEPVISDIIGQATTPFLRSQTDNIGRRLVNCIDDETYRCVQTQAELQYAPGSWNGHHSAFTAVYHVDLACTTQTSKCVLFCHLADVG